MAITIGRMEMEGKRFGELTILKMKSEKKPYIDSTFECVCSCGNYRICNGRYLRRGSIKRCIPCKRILHAKSVKRHGMTKTTIYGVWRSMLARCTKPQATSFKDYGGRGITVCDRWMKFENFYEDMGDREKGLELDRIDNNRGYSKDNCRWTTSAENNRNKRGCATCNCQCRIKRLAKNIS